MFLIVSESRVQIQTAIYDNLILDPIAEEGIRPCIDGNEQKNNRDEAEEQGVEQ
ncbi:hypothetical protein D3C84_1205520 [compost metagenome]